MIREVALLIFLSAAICAYPSTDSKIASGEPPLVTSPLGQVKGTIIKSRLGKDIYSFRGIRYAKAPVKELRFQPPVPAEKWEGVLNATEDAPLCPQPTTDKTSEDCLFVNVYSTKLPKGNDKPKKPVVVYIHGGGFYSFGGASYWAGPNYLLDQDIVLVTFNYRLGTLGFLSTGDKEAPGNNGLKDQVELLKWVKKNIESFGGDPNSVTLLGYSAGSAAALLHMVSPLSKGLFHRVIAMSGSSLGNWPVPKNQLNVAKKQAKLVGCPEDNAANIIKCLKTKPAQEIAETLPKFKEFANDPVMIWYPVIEGDFGQPRFLPDHPIKLIQSGQFTKVPLITGITADEFGQRAFTVLGKDSYLQELNNNFEKVAPIAFLYERDTDNSKTISKALKSFYLKDKPVDKSSLTGLAQLYADGIIGFGVNRAAKLIAEKSSEPVYYYRFSYQGRFSLFYTPESNNTAPYGVVHADDLIYLFYVKKLFPLFEQTTPPEVGMVNKLTTLWGNFAKTGNPIPQPNEKLDNVKWEPFNTKTQKYLDLGNKLVLHEKLYDKRYSEWEKLFPLSAYAKA